ncbi:MAG: YitT family protein [Lewinellaceae bacterium]|nr:YitT family protein [Lewinellaceae bacterium]
MNPFFQFIILQALKRKKKRTPITYPPLPNSESEQLVKEVKVEITHIIRDYLLIGVGALAASFGLLGFLLPNDFIDGGVTGISLLVEVVSGWPLSLLLVIINLPFILLGNRTIGREFMIRSITGIVLLAILVHVLQIPLITEDKLLIAVFGGFFLGLGIGLAIRGGAVLDGTEVLAIFISRKTSLTIGDIILFFNIIIFSVAAYILTVETALYAILTYLTASKTVDFVIDGLEEYIGVTIVSHRSEDIRLAIIEKMGRGCTIYQGKRGFGKAGDKLGSTDIIFTVITRLELAKLQTEIDKIDRNAFVIMGSLKDVRGGMIKKRKLAH